MKIYVTKYCLTQGILEVNAERGAEHPDVAIVRPQRGSYGIASFYHRNQWFENRDDAIANAESRRIKKIDSLNAQLSKLRDLKFK